MNDNLGNAWVNIAVKDAGFSKSLDEAHGKTSKLVGSLAGIGGAAAAGFAIAGAAIVAGLAKAVSLASDLGETTSKVGVIFGDAAKDVVASSNEMSNAFGVSKKEYLDAVANMGAVFKGMGQTQAQAAKLGDNLAKLAVDMSSFGNTSMEEALAAIQSGLRGEADPLEKFGVFLSAAKVEAEALALGYRKMGGEFTDSAKKAATVSLMLKQTTDAQGDASRTADSTSNQFKRLWGTLENSLTSVGESLLPAVNAGVKFFNALLVEAGGSSSSWGGIVSTAVQYVATTFDNLTYAVQNADLIWEAAKLTIADFGQTILNVISAAGTNLALFGGWVAGNWKEILYDGFNGVKTVLTNLGDNVVEFAKAAQPWLDFFGQTLKNLATSLWEFVKNPMGGFNFDPIPMPPFEPNFKPLLEGFKATAAEMPQYVNAVVASSDAEFAALGEKARKREEERKKNAKDKSAPKMNLTKDDLKGWVNPDTIVKMEISVVNSGAELAAKLQAKAAEVGVDTAKATLEQAKKTADAAAKTAENTDKLVNKSNVAVAG